MILIIITLYFYCPAIFLGKFFWAKWGLLRFFGLIYIARIGRFVEREIIKLDGLMEKPMQMDDQQEEIDRQVDIMRRKRKEAIFQLGLFLANNGGHIERSSDVDAQLVVGLKESVIRLNELHKKVCGDDGLLEQMMLETENFIMVVEKIIELNRYL